MLCSICPRNATAMGSHGQPSLFFSDRASPAWPQCSATWVMVMEQDMTTGNLQLPIRHLGSHQTNHRMDPNLWLQVLRLGQQIAFSVHEMWDADGCWQALESTCQLELQHASSDPYASERWWNYGKPTASSFGTSQSGSLNDSPLASADRLSWRHVGPGHEARASRLSWSKPYSNRGNLSETY